MSRETWPLIILFWFWYTPRLYLVGSNQTFVFWCKDDIPFLSLTPYQPRKSFGLLVPELLAPEEHSHPAHSVSTWEAAGTFPTLLFQSDQLWYVRVGLFHFRLKNSSLKVKII